MDLEKMGFHSIFDTFHHQRDAENVGFAVSKVIVDNKRLIECVKQHEELYVGNHPKCTDTRHKDAVWDNIALSLGIPVSICKRSWFNLRDSYRRVLRKRREAIQDKLPYHKWRYDDQMSFLAPHITIREANDRLLHYEFPPQPDDPNISSASTENNTSPNSHHLAADHPSTGSIEKPKRKRDATYAPYAVIGNHVPRIMQTDHIDAFLMGVGATLKNFTPYNQSLAKRKIFALISEMEMQQIIERKEYGENSSLSPPGGDDEDRTRNMIKPDNKIEQIDIKIPAIYHDEKERTTTSQQQVDAHENGVTTAVVMKVEEDLDVKKEILNTNYYNSTPANYYPSILPYN